MCKKDDFLLKSKKIHNDLYSYDKVDYINSKTKVILTCKIHGDFEIIPNLHIYRKSGCKKCSFINRVDKSKIKKYEFINRSNLMHNYKYNYDKVLYNNLSDDIIITCKEHGDFIQKVSSHLYGKGCRYCFLDKIKSNYTKFIEKSILVNGDEFNYDKFEYIDSKTPSIILCKNGHEFERTPNRHLSKKDKCVKCEMEKYLNKSLKKLNEIVGFTYNQVNGELFEIKCLKCLNSFNRKSSAHQKLKNCIYCNPNKYDRDFFIKKSKEKHGDLYNYIDVIYLDSKEPVKIMCENHGSFEQIPNNHLMGSGCPKCNRFNKKEESLLKFISDNYDGEIIKSDRKVLNGKELDIYLPELKLAFEFNGLYWHSELYKDNKYHLNKTNKCLESDIQLIHIWEDDWDLRPDIVKSIILNKLGVSERIWARKCKIKEVDNKDVREFLIKNHIQGFVGSKIKLGLYYNGELVSLMTFGSVRKSLGQKSKEGDWELLRFCNKIGYSVVGGASKLFKYFINNYNVNEVISYSDNSRGFGKLYKNLGFEFKSESRPNYYYIIDGVKKHRFNFRKDKLVRDGKDPNKTEVQIMNDCGYFRIWDCGNKKWIYKV